MKENKNKMDNKVVIVTGATSGIGKACAMVFGSSGAKVVATGRDNEKLEKLAKELDTANIEYLTILADASSEVDNKMMVEEAYKKFGRIDVLICNAGISMRSLFEDLDLKVFRKVMDINFYGAVYATKYALPYIMKSEGSIIAISSINGHRGTPARTAYTASKYAMEGFFEALRTEVMNKNVHLLVVSPGFTSSNIRKNALTGNGTIQGESPRDENKMMTSQEVAVAVYKAWKKKKRDLILTTQGKLVVLLNKFFPKQMDRIVYKTMAKEPDSPFK